MRQRGAPENPDRSSAPFGVGHQAWGQRDTPHDSAVKPIEVIHGTKPLALRKEEAGGGLPGVEEEARQRIREPPPVRPRVIPDEALAETRLWVLHPAPDGGATAKSSKLQSRPASATPRERSPQLLP